VTRRIIGHIIRHIIRSIKHNTNGSEKVEERGTVNEAAGKETTTITKRVGLTEIAEAYKDSDSTVMTKELYEWDNDCKAMIIHTVITKSNNILETWRCVKRTIKTITRKANGTKSVDVCKEKDSADELEGETETCDANGNKVIVIRKVTHITQCIKKIKDGLEKLISERQEDEDVVYCAALKISVDKNLSETIINRCIIKIIRTLENGSTETIVTEEEALRMTNLDAHRKSGLMAQQWWSGRLCAESPGSTERTALASRRKSSAKKKMMESRPSRPRKSSAMQTTAWSQSHAG
jgi:hypothetical protein